MLTLLFRGSRSGPLGRAARLLAGLALGWLLTLGARPARAQDAALLLNRHYQLKYQVPATWQPTRLVSDSLSVLRYDSPDGTTRLWVGQLRGPAGQLPPAQALQRLLRRLGASRHREHHVSAHGLDFLESTGTCHVDGRTLRYDARVALHQGQVLVVYVYATPENFALQEPLLHRVLNSLTPVSGRPQP